MGFTHIGTELRVLVERSCELLESFSDADASLRPAPGKWSKKEILGHLIDSASNNHQRFVRARFQDDLVFPGYEQDRWIDVQRYQERPWRELVELWRAFNLHIAHVMDSTPPEVAERVHRRHNFHQIAWRTVPESEPTTLGYFFVDYVGHMRHHLGQAALGFER